MRILVSAVNKKESERKKVVETLFNVASIKIAEIVICTISNRRLPSLGGNAFDMKKTSGQAIGLKTQRKDSI
jgi:hypothetical protein